MESYLYIKKPVILNEMFRITGFLYFLCDAYTKRMLTTNTTVSVARANTDNAIE